MGTLRGGLGMIMGGDSKAEQESKRIIAEGVAYADNLALVARIQDASEQDLKIALLRSKGLDEEADTMERKIALAKKLAEIDASALGENIKAQLKSDAIAISAAEAETKKNAAAQKAANDQIQKNQALAKSIREQQQGLADDRLAGTTGADRLKGLEERMKQMRSDAALNGVSLNEAGIADMQKRGDFAGADKSLRALREYEALQREVVALTKALKDEAAAEAAVHQAVVATNAARMQGLAQAVVQTALDTAAADAKKKALQADALGDMKTKAAISHARAHGHGRKAERMESAAGEAEKMKQLMANGMPADEAAKMASSMQRDEDKLAGRRSTIRSPKPVDNFGIDGARFPGLDAMKAKQGKSLRDEFQFPALDAMAKKQAATNAQRGERGKASSTDTLLEAAVKALNAIEKNLVLAN
jgi:hypothetical protein